MKDVILKADDLYFSYEGEKNHSLNGLSLEIERGKKIAFMGANGSGKSTFFLCCNGIHKPVRGLSFRIRTTSCFPPAFTRKFLLVS